jgi:hypothetical protein
LDELFLELGRACVSPAIIERSYCPKARQLGSRYFHCPYISSVNWILVVDGISRTNFISYNSSTNENLYRTNGRQALGRAGGRFYSLLPFDYKQLSNLVVFQFP